MVIPFFLVFVNDVERSLSYLQQRTQRCFGEILQTKTGHAINVKAFNILRRKSGERSLSFQDFNVKQTLTARIWYAIGYSNAGM